jgi:hypothetical protein
MKVTVQTSQPLHRKQVLLQHMSPYNNPSCDLLEIHELLRSNMVVESYTPRRGGSPWTKKL